MVTNQFNSNVGSLPPSLNWHAYTTLSIKISSSYASKSIPDTSTSSIGSKSYITEMTTSSTSFQNINITIIICIQIPSMHMKYSINRECLNKWNRWFFDWIKAYLLEKHLSVIACWNRGKNIFRIGWCNIFPTKRKWTQFQG